jgi:hypothetical protein
MDMDFAVATRLTVDTTNLKNPESIEVAGDITITTLMKYTQDSQFWPIDKATQASNFQAIQGTIDDTLMKATSLMTTPDFSTNANNQ